MNELRVTVAKQLERFAEEIDREAREFPNLLMLPTTETSYKGFLTDADKILSLLPSPAMSGVEAVSTCIQCCGLGGEIPQKAMNILCPDCHGTDKIVRELTEHEASEAFRDLIPFIREHLISGETLRLKKEAVTDGRLIAKPYPDLHDQD